MHLRSITLRGFKSFPDRTRLEFAPGVSVIVGPNGSGKSNITDAVLWAMGEQSPLAVRGQAMQDVIFAGAHGVQARTEAEVEVVIDNADGAIDLPLAEISILRRLDRAGEGEYRINGARCRLVEVLEILSDTNLGKEMHSIVSQGRVEAIVTSKARDRRMLIEEAAGLGKHRKRRRRAQLKLERTQSNLDRALDVEREARSRLRPLKRQAEAAELHERLERQTHEARWILAREAVRAARAALAEAAAGAAAAREAAAAAERGLSEVAARRERAERALAERGAEREALSGRFYAARSAGERIAMRLDAARTAALRARDRAERRRALLDALATEAAGDTPDDGAAARVAALEAELARLAEDRRARLELELAALAERRGAAAGETARAHGSLEERLTAREAADAAAEAARSARREADRQADRARREAARTGSELAVVTRFLRAHAGAPGGAAALVDTLEVEPGFELALAAALGPRLRAAVAGDLGGAEALLDRAGAEGGSALVAGAEPSALARTRRPRTPGAERLIDRVGGGDAETLALLRVLLADTWVVASLDVLEPGFDGIAVTRSGRVWLTAQRELRQVPAGGEERVLAERNRRDALVAESERAAQAERAALAAVEGAAAAVASADTARDDADAAARDAARRHADAADAERRIAGQLEQRRRAPEDDGAAAARRAEIEAGLAAERRLAERSERERRLRDQRTGHERSALAADEALAPRAERLAAALEAAGEGVGVRLRVLEAELQAGRAATETLAAELRGCAAEEADVQAELKRRAETVTQAEVAAQRARDRSTDADRELDDLAGRLGLEAQAAPEPLAAEEAEALRSRIERLARRREQLGPVNPLAQDEYAEALAHVEELERLREDSETALRELQGLIRDIDKRIREAFEETFTAAASNFEEVAGQLFPGGRGRLRLVREDAGPRAVLGGEEPDEGAPSPEAADAIDPGMQPEDRMGVEIEITPAGKATKRLSLLSGGEKSLTALAFLFAVFLARPCPFYILDEVEAALDDLNIDRFLTLLRRYADRAQFIVVTHQKRTMEAADCLYGVSMAGNGVSQVVSRRLPPRAVA